MLKYFFVLFMFWLMNLFTNTKKFIGHCLATLFTIVLVLLISIRKNIWDLPIAL